ncbi:Outer membrane protein OprJ [Alteromonas alvinellae]
MHKIKAYRAPKTTLLSLTLMLALGGCSLAPEYKKPENPVSASWISNEANRIENKSTISSGAQVNWQEFVKDRHLAALIELALNSNRDLKQTLLNVKAARAQYGIQRADTLPTIAVQSTATRQRTPEDLRIPGMPSVQNTYRAGVGFTSFELDFFGRVENMTEAALQEYLATEEAAQSLRISLIADVIQSYLVYQGAVKRLDIAEQIKLSREVTQSKIKQRQAFGAATAIEFQDALALTLQSYVEVERLKREQELAQNALTLLVGVQDITPMLNKISLDESPIVDEISPGAPSELLIFRPDIRSAEHQLMARNANIGAARAAFFPSISLTGFFGASSMELSELFNSGQRSWSFSPQLSLPIIDNGRNQANLELAKIRKDIAVANYEQTIQLAFKEVADALASIDTLRREQTAQEKLTETSKERLRLSRARYENGIDDNLRFLDAQRENLTSQLAAINVRTQKQIAISTLYRSLGGGWFSGADSAEQVSQIK